MEIPLLTDVCIIFGLSIAALLTCDRLRVPSIVGLLLTGILCGPHGLSLIDAVDEVEILAEIGVVLLLFTIGLEFSLRNLVRIKKQVLIGGALQVGLTIGITFAGSLFRGYDAPQSFFFGCLVALSSTAIVLKVLQEQAQMTTPHGQSTLAILIFQDVVIVPFVLMVPFLAGEGGSLWDVGLKLGAGFIVLGGVLIASLWAIPRLLFQIAKTHNTQTFLLCVLFICFSVAWLTSSIGLSLALGAFLAGLIISESEYSHHTVGIILPFQMIFTSFFFVSIGMLLNIGYVFSNPYTILGITTMVVVVKALIAGLVPLILGYPLRTAVQVGLSLAQVGEFSFVLAAVGASYQLINGEDYQLFLAVSLTTMALTPAWIHLGLPTIHLLKKLGLPKWLLAGRATLPLGPRETLKDHVIIIGFGLCGQHLAWAMKQNNIPYAILEINPETVRKHRRDNQPIYFGDATHEAVLERVDIDQAKLVALAINDTLATRRISQILKQLYPNIHLITRTKYMDEVPHILELGADEVVPEEFETSIVVFSKVLAHYGVEKKSIDTMAQEIRKRHLSEFHQSQ